MNKDWVFQSYNQRWISKQALKMSKHNADSVIHGTIFIFYGSKMFFFLSFYTYRRTENNSRQNFETNLANELSWRPYHLSLIPDNTSNI